MKLDDKSNKGSDKDYKKESENNFDNLNITDAIFKNAPQIIMVVDEDRRVRRINHEGLLIADKELEDAIGLRGGEAINCVHAWDNSKGCGYGFDCSNCTVRNTVLDTFSNKKNYYNIEAKIILKRNNTIMDVTVLISTIYIAANDNEDNHAIVYLTNISKQKEVEQQLSKANSTKDKFFSVIAHDLVSPFGTMLGFSELLVNKSSDEDNKEQCQQYVKLLNSTIKDTYKLLENLLLWSRSQVGSIHFSPETIDLHQLTSNIIEPLKINADIKSIKINNQIPENILIEADVDILSTILRNILANAIKFTHKAGEITIGHDFKTNQNNIKHIEIFVKDNGIGIPEESIDNLFKIDKNISQNGTEEEEGSGLGLILCKEFIEIHNGSIRVESKVDIGSRFIISIPVENSIQ